MKIVVGLGVILFLVVLPLFIFVMVQVRAIRSRGREGKGNLILDMVMFGVIEGPFTSLVLAEPATGDDDSARTARDAGMANDMGQGYILPTEVKD